MQSTDVKSPVMIYTEQTPNPESLKYVTNRIVYKGTADFREEESAKEWSPLAAYLFSLPYVEGVYINNNFVSVTKAFNFEWADVMLKLKEEIKAYLEADKPVMNDGYEDAKTALEEERLSSIQYSEADAELVQKIKDLIDTYVKPAVEMDGGNIEFQSYQEGVVHVVMQGSCSGCPSSTVTLKQGIEGMLQRMVPQVKEVVAVMG